MSKQDPIKERVLQAFQHNINYFYSPTGLASELELPIDDVRDAICDLYIDEKKITRHEHFRCLYRIVYTVPPFLAIVYKELKLAGASSNFIAMEFGVPIGTAFRVLEALVERGYAEKEGNSYHRKPSIDRTNTQSVSGQPSNEMSHTEWLRSVIVSALGRTNVPMSMNSIIHIITKSIGIDRKFIPAAVRTLLKDDILKKVGKTKGTRYYLNRV